MRRVAEPELMDDAAQARAYAEADFSEAHQGYVDRFRQTFPRSVPKRVVDLGCGPGDITLRFWRAWPQCSILAVDGAGAMLALARRAVAAAKATDHIQLQQAVLPAENLPAAAFDTVLSNSLLHHLAEPSVLWNTIRHCAGNGACIWVMDLLRPRDEARLAALVSQYTANAPPVLQHDFRCSLMAAYTVEELQAQLQQAGLSTLSVQAVSDRHVQVSGQLFSDSGT